MAPPSSADGFRSARPAACCAKAIRLAPLASHKWSKSPNKSRAGRARVRSPARAPASATTAAEVSAPTQPHNASRFLRRGRKMARALNELILADLIAARAETRPDLDVVTFE